MGLMGRLADGALAEGGKVIGVIPDFMNALEWGHPGITELLVVRDMHKRKHLMIQNANAVVALPGGSGTLEELLEAISLKRLSTFMWMSSSARENENVPASISPLTWARPFAIAWASAASMMPWRASMARWASEPAMSWAASLRSNSIEALISSITSAGRPMNRPPHIVLLIEMVPDAWT